MKMGSVKVAVYLFGRKQYREYVFVVVNGVFFRILSMDLSEDREFVPMIAVAVA